LTAAVTLCPFLKYKDPSCGDIGEGAFIYPSCKHKQAVSTWDDWKCTDSCTDENYPELLKLCCATPCNLCTPECNDCPIGEKLIMQSLTSAKIIVECDTCGAGKFSVDKFACGNCPQGLVSEDKNIVDKCTQCPTGKFFSEETICVCPPSHPFAQPSEGNPNLWWCYTDQNDQNGGVCRYTGGALTPDRNDNWGTNQNPCVKSDQHWSECWNSRTGDVCTLCPKGYYSDALQSTTCKPCTIGKFQDQKGQASCKTCGRDTRPTDNNCVECKPGKFSNDPTTDCKLCPPGHVYVLSLSRCIGCSRGKYAGQNDEDAPDIECISCDTGTVTGNLKMTKKTANIDESTCEEVYQTTTQIFNFNSVHDVTTERLSGYFESALKEALKTDLTNPVDTEEVVVDLEFCYGCDQNNEDEDTNFQLEFNILVFLTGTDTTKKTQYDDAERALGDWFAFETKLETAFIEVMSKRNIPITQPMSFTTIVIIVSSTVAVFIGLVVGLFFGCNKDD